MACGDVDALLALIDRTRAKLIASGVESPAALVCYEAGYEGFCLYRHLVALGVRVVAINPASLLVDRRAKRAKTDRIDARAMVCALMAWARGERQVLERGSCADRRAGRRAPWATRASALGEGANGSWQPDQRFAEDARDQLLFHPRAADAAERLDAIVTGDGRPLAPYLKREELVRELKCLALVMRQIDRVEAERDAVVKTCDAGAGTDALASEPEREAAMIGELNRLKGIGMNDATILVREAFGRDIQEGLGPARQQCRTRQTRPLAIERLDLSRRFVARLRGPERPEGPPDRQADRDARGRAPRPHQSGRHRHRPVPRLRLDPHRGRQDRARLPWRRT